MVVVSIYLERDPLNIESRDLRWVDGYPVISTERFCFDEVICECEDGVISHLYAGTGSCELMRGWGANLRLTEYIEFF